MKKPRPPWDVANSKAGLHPSCALFLGDRRVAAVGCDSNSDTAPSVTKGVGFPIHVLTLVAMGVHLLDYLHLDELAGACEEAGRWEFLFVGAPLASRAERARRSTRSRCSKSPSSDDVRASNTRLALRMTRDSDLVGVPVALGLIVALLAVLAAFFFVGPLVGIIVLVGVVTLESRWWCASSGRTRSSSGPARKVPFRVPF